MKSRTWILLLLSATFPTTLAVGTPPNPADHRWPKPSELADRLIQFHLVETTSYAALNPDDKAPGEPFTVITQRCWDWKNKPEVDPIEDPVPTARRRSDSDTGGNTSSDSFVPRRRSNSDSDGNTTPDSNYARRKADVSAEVWKIGKCGSRSDNLQIEAEWVMSLYGPRRDGLSTEQIVRLASSVSEPLSPVMRKSLDEIPPAQSDWPSIVRRAGNVGFKLSPREWVIFDLRPVQPLINSMKSKSYSGRSFALQRLGWIGPRAEKPLIDALLKQFYQGQEDTRADFLVVDLLAEIGAPAVEPMCNALDDPTLPVGKKCQVVAALGRIGPAARPALPRLRSLQRHRNVALREAAATARSQIEPPKPVMYDQRRREDL